MLAKNIWKEYKLFLYFGICISLAILSVIFIQIGYFFYELCMDIFFWTQCIYTINQNAFVRYYSFSEVVTV